MSSSHWFLLSQPAFSHILGSVYLNCYSTPVMRVSHNWHLKAPEISSGLTSVDRVTVPSKAVS